MTRLAAILVSISLLVAAPGPEAYAAAAGSFETPKPKAANIRGALRVSLVVLPQASLGTSLGGMNIQGTTQSSTLAPPKPGQQVTDARSASAIPAEVAKEATPALPANTQDPAKTDGNVPDVGDVQVVDTEQPSDVSSPSPEAEKLAEQGRKERDGLRRRLKGLNPFGSAGQEEAPEQTTEAPDPIRLKPGEDQPLASEPSSVQSATPPTVSPRFTRWYNRALLRGIDIVVGAAGTLLLAAALPILAVAIKASDGGPIFFTQTRLGHRGQEFTIWKLRTMKPNSDRMPSAQDNNQTDPRITRVGHFLRHWKIDEWPQFVQVLLGQMSVVGFRPRRPQEITSDFRATTFFLKPALTEYFFVTSGGMSPLPGQGSDEKAAANQYYLENWSWTLYAKAFLAMFISLRSGKRGLKLDPVPNPPKPAQDPPQTQASNSTRNGNSTKRPWWVLSKDNTLGEAIVGSLVSIMVSPGFQYWFARYSWSGKPPKAPVLFLVLLPVILYSVLEIHNLGHYLFAKWAGVRRPKNYLEYFLSGWPDPVVYPENARREFWWRLGGPALNLFIGLAFLFALWLLDSLLFALMPNYLVSQIGILMTIGALLHLVTGLGALLPLREGKGGHKLLELWREMRELRAVLKTYLRSLNDPKLGYARVPRGLLMTEEQEKLLRDALIAELTDNQTLGYLNSKLKTLYLNLDKEQWLASKAFQEGPGFGILRDYLRASEEALNASLLPGERVRLVSVEAHLAEEGKVPRTTEEHIDTRYLAQTKSLLEAGTVLYQGGSVVPHTKWTTIHKNEYGQWYGGYVRNEGGLAVETTEGEDVFMTVEDREGATGIPGTAHHAPRYKDRPSFPRRLVLVMRYELVPGASPRRVAPLRLPAIPPDASTNMVQGAATATAFSTNAHAAVNQVIRDRYIANEGAALMGPRRGWRSVFSLGFFKGLKARARVRAALRGLAAKQQPGIISKAIDLSALGIPEAVDPLEELRDATWVALGKPGERSPPGLIQREGYTQYGHIGARYSSIYTSLADARALLEHPEELQAYLWHHAIELATKKAARKHGVPWTEALARQVHDLYAVPQERAISTHVNQVLGKSQSAASSSPFLLPDGGSNSVQFTAGVLGLILMIPIPTLILHTLVSMHPGLALIAALTGLIGLELGLLALYPAHNLGHYLFAKWAGVPDAKNFREYLMSGLTAEQLRRYGNAYWLARTAPKLHPQNTAQHFWWLLGGPAFNFFFGLILFGLAVPLIVLGHSDPESLLPLGYLALLASAWVQGSSALAALLPIREDRGGAKLLELWPQMRRERWEKRAGLNPKASSLPIIELPPYREPSLESKNLSELKEIAVQRYGIPAHLIADAETPPDIVTLDDYRKDVERNRALAYGHDFASLSPAAREVLIRIRAAKLNLAVDINNMRPDDPKFNFGGLAFSSWVANILNFGRALEAEFPDRTWVYLYADMVSLQTFTPHPGGRSVGVYLGRSNLTRELYKYVWEKIAEEKRHSERVIAEAKKSRRESVIKEEFLRLESRVVNAIIYRLASTREGPQIVAYFLQQLRDAQVVDDQNLLIAPIVLIDGPQLQTMLMLAETILIYGNELNRTRVDLRAFEGHLSQYNTYLYNGAINENIFTQAHPANYGVWGQDAPKFVPGSAMDQLRYYVMLHNFARLRERWKRLEFQPERADDANTAMYLELALDNQSPQSLIARIARGGPDRDDALNALTTGPFRARLVHAFSQKYAWLPHAYVEEFVDNALTVKYWQEIQAGKALKPQGWFYAVVNNSITDYIRRTRATKIVSIETLASEESSFDPPDPWSEDLNDSRQEEADAKVRQVLASFAVALRLVPKGYREVLELHYLQGQTPEQIAEFLHLRLSQVKAKLAEGLNLVQKLLRENPLQGISAIDLEEAIAALPETERQVLSLRLEGKTLEEIGRLSGHSLSWAKTQLLNAKLDLRNRLELKTHPRL